MKPDTRHSPPPPGRRPLWAGGITRQNPESFRGSSLVTRRGVALIVTLTVMALLLILAVAFVVNMRTERLASRSFSDQVKAREMALTGLHAAIGQMQSFFTAAERSNCVVATMPGMFYWSNTTTRASGKQCMFSYQPQSQRNYFSAGQSRNVNLNGGNYQPGERYLPVFNPYNQPSSSLGDMNNVRMYADWLPVWKTGDSRIYNYSQSASGTSISTIGLGDAGRYAFWIDDESVKINLNNVGGAGIGQTNVTFVPGKTAAPTADIQPASGRFDVRHLSSIDLAALDINSRMAGRWSSAGVLNEIDRARHPSPDRWMKFQTPEDILGVVANLTMQDFQAAKPCLTVWSEDTDDFSQLFRYTANNSYNAAANINRPQIRTNVSATIKDMTQRNYLYYFLVSQLKSQRIKDVFGGASYFEKYKSTPPNTQPLCDPRDSSKSGGSLEQIAANIVSYVSDPSVPPIVTQPAGNIVNPGVNTPTGACGLRKAAYMNEITVGVHWQMTKAQEGSGQTAKPAEWTLWGAIYVEMINPYTDEAMPRISMKEKYQIICDYDFGFKGTVQTPPGDITSSLPKPQILVDASTPDIKHLVPVNSYSYALQNLTGQTQTPPYSYLFNGNKFPIKVGMKGEVAQKPQDAKPPYLSDLKVTLPQRIRQLALPSMILQGTTVNYYIADWFDSTTPGQVAPQVLDIAQGGKVQPAALPSSEGLREPRVEEVLGTTNPARVSIAKDDPRVHCWNGPFTQAQITIALTGPDPTGSKNSFTTQGDSKVGDGETLSTPERYSNFVIAERGMQSVGEIGFIHTGKPWRSLSLQRYGIMPDEQNASTTARLPDWAIMDLLTVYNKPIVGRININNAGWQCGYNSDWENKTQPNLFEAWGSVNSWGQAGRRNAATNPADPWSHTLAAALNFIRNTSVRNTLVQYIVRQYFATGAVTNPDGSGAFQNPHFPYYSIGELSNVRYMGYYDTSSASPSTRATTDAQKEETIRRICNVLTTRSDVFTVHSVGQAFGNGRLTGEARLMAVVQRINEYDTALRNLSNPGWYRFRIRHLHWVHND